MKKILTAVVISFALAACSTPGQKPAPMKLDYSGLGQVKLNVQFVGVINRADGLPRYRPYVTHTFQPTVIDAVTRWANDRFKAAGNSGRANVTIKEANVTEQAVPMEEGFNSWFTRQQSRRYTAKIEVGIDAVAADGSKAFATASATRSYTLAEDPTEIERAEAYNSMLNSLIENLNSNAEQAIQNHMDAFITR